MFFPTMSAIPDWSHCMYDVFAGQSISFCDFRITSFASVQRSAFGQKLRTCSAMDAAIDSPTTKQRTVGSIYDGIDGHPRYIVSNNL